MTQARSLHSLLQDLLFSSVYCPVFGVHLSTLGYSAENLAVIRHIAVNLITQEKSAKVGTRAKRKKAGWDDQYLFKVLAQSLPIAANV